MLTKKLFLPKLRDGQSLSEGRMEEEMWGTTCAAFNVCYMLKK